MCIGFQDGLNDDTQMFVVALKLCEFVELSKRVQKTTVSERPPSRSTLAAASCRQPLRHVHQRHLRP